MRQASATHPRTITAVAIGTVLHKAPILGAPGKVQDCNQAEQVQPASASHFLAPDMTPPIHAASMIRRLSCAHSSQESVRRRRVTTQGWLAGWAGPVRRIPLSNKGLLHHVHAFVLSKESAPPPTAHHAIVSRRPVANPPNRLHATGADRRTSLTSLYVSPSCGVPRDDASGHALVRGHREGDREVRE